MVAELRKVNNKLALYTNDDRVYKSLYKRSYTLHRAPYLQEGKLVAVDLYFDRRVASTLTQVINGQLLLEI